MLAKLKDWKNSEYWFEWYQKVLKKTKASSTLENWIVYPNFILEFKKESWWKRSKKDDITFDVNKVNLELKFGEYELKIEQLNKECESWMQDVNDLKKELLNKQKENLELEISKESLQGRYDILKEVVKEESSETLKYKKENKILTYFIVWYIVLDIVAWIL